MMTAITSALTGMQNHQHALAQHAERISRWGTGDPTAPVDLADELVGVVQAKHGYTANLAVLRAADTMLGSLLDVLA
jgi:flagellar hook protein FlgE